MTGATDGLAAFLAARYDEAEALARAVLEETRHCDQCDALASGSWAVNPDHAPLLEDQGSEVMIVYDQPPTRTAMLAHIAANDPAHRLADIVLKRAILAEHRPNSRAIDQWTRCCGCNDSNGDYLPWPCKTVRLLGSEFAEHPEYREAWRP